jgi:hypothetical protein
MPNTRISDLTAATSVAGTDVYPSVQTAGVGPVKTSLTQITAFALANAPAGAVGAPSIAPTGDTNTGFWFPAADTIAASTGGTTRLYIDSAGNVGIGTASPNAKLDVANGAIFVGSSANTSQTNTLLNGYGYNIGATLYGNTSIRSTYSNADNSASLEFYVASGGTSTNERMRITSAGNVGIGTASPVVRLYVADTTSVSTAFDVTAGGVNGRIYDFYCTTNLFRQRLINDAYSSATDAYELGRSGMSVSYHRWLVSTGTEAMRITSAGNVGIGTTSPLARLVVSNSSDENIEFTAGSGAVNGGVLQYINRNTETTRPDMNYFLATGGGSHKFYTSSSERMRITSAGNVLIGTTSSPTTGTQCLTIETETAPTATPADTVTFYSSDLSAGNTMPSFYTEGTIVGTGTPTANRTIAVRINGTVYYLLASTIP